MGGLRQYAVQEAINQDKYDSMKVQSLFQTSSRPSIVDSGLSTMLEHALSCVHCRV